MLRRFFSLVMLVLALCGAGLFVRPSTALAQVDTGLSQVGKTVKLGSADPRVIATRIINISLGFVGIILVVLIMYAGFLWMTAGGNAEQIAKAKKFLVNAIIGLILVLSSWAIARYVIEKLLGATQGGGGGVQSQQNLGGGGGFGGGGGSGAFQVKTISPHGDAPRNTTVKLLFTRPVDEKTVSAITVTKVGGTTVGGSFSVVGSTVTFTPADPCGPPIDLKVKCFDGNSDFKVQVSPSLRSSQGQAIVCGGFAPACASSFHVTDAVDLLPPTAELSDTFNGRVPSESLVTVAGKGTDDFGISYLSFFANDTRIDDDGPVGTSTQKTFDGSVQWDTAGLPLQSIQTLTMTAFDLDSNEKVSNAVQVVVRPKTCFDGVKNGDETDIDCGGTPGTPSYCGACHGGMCQSNLDCAGGICQEGVCVDQPVITKVSPNDGKAGTFVTIQGYNFGKSGTVIFEGSPAPMDDKVATFPQVCQQNGKMWQPTQVVVAVPEGAAIGRIRLINGDSKLGASSKEDFLVNDVSHPGLCAVNPAQGFTGDAFKATGQGFGPKPDTLVFGAKSLSTFSGWKDDEIEASVPIVGTGNYSVQVKANGSQSNVVAYNVMDKALSGPPTILSVTPEQGQRGLYITLFGKNFGATTGKVIFKNKITGQTATNDPAVPPMCDQNGWRETAVVVKVPSEFANKQPIKKEDLGDYTLTLVRADSVSSNAVNFVMVDGRPGPGICAIMPSVGPVGTNVTVVGEHFGTDAGSVIFTSKVQATNDKWGDVGVSLKVPSKAATGPVVVQTTTSSNPYNFQVMNCREQTGSCPKGTQCCEDGSCNIICPAVNMSAAFAWQSSTGLIPVAPRVVEECTPKDSSVIPSPSPWESRTGGSQVCVTPVAVTARFTRHLDAQTVTKTNVVLKKCTAKSKDPCLTTEVVQTDVDPKHVQAANQDQDFISFSPLAKLDSKTTYLVEIMTGVRGAGPTGAYMDQKEECAKGVGYCFRFTTRDSEEPCKVGSVVVSPTPFTVNSKTTPVPYVASPISQEDACLVLQCDAYDWKWQHGDDGGGDGKGNDSRAIFKEPLQPGKLPGTVSCKQIGFGVGETGDAPVHMSAIVMPDTVKGKGDLYVKYLPPRIKSFGPNCNQACTNAAIWAEFSAKMDTASFVNAVVVKECASENCFANEMGAPLVVPVPVFSKDDSFVKISTKGILKPGKYYHVLLKAGDGSGVKGENGVPLSDLNDPEGFAWNFRTKWGEDAICATNNVVVVPEEKFETVVGARQLFEADPYGKPDECDAGGQLLNDVGSATWQTKNANVADFVLISKKLIDTGAPLSARCSGKCLAMGSQGEVGKIAMCGNGKIETTDAQYCAPVGDVLLTPWKDMCVLMAPGSKAGEECDPGIKADAELCDPHTCLWKPTKQIVQGGSCGNGKVDFGESCDFGSRCMGASPTSTTPDGTVCTNDPTTCQKNGGVCAPMPYRGCSAFCRHTGASSGGSTCGSAPGDIGDGEDCDDGNVTNGDGCSSQCLHEGSTDAVVAVCGDAVLQPGETCEKAEPNGKFPDGCNTVTCLHTGSQVCAGANKLACCGNGKIEYGEDCDDGNTQNGDGCSSQCLLEGSSAAYQEPSFCSDSYLGTGEQCEAGLPSNTDSFLVKGMPKNAAPVHPQGVLKGDDAVDSVQLARIVGEEKPDDKGLMSTELTATIQDKTGQAVYGLQCGFTDEASCPDGTGLTDGGCCAPRPITVASTPHGDAVCRNTQIKVTMNVAMDVPSMKANFLIAKEYAGSSCPKGLIEVTDNFEAVHRGWFWPVQRLWSKVVALVTGRPTLAGGPLCAGGVTGTLAQTLVKSDDPNVPPVESTKEFTFLLDHSLEANTLYHIKLVGGYVKGKNIDPKSKVGIKSSFGVMADASEPQNTWEFKTGDKLCAVNNIVVTDTSVEHPYLFLAKDEEHVFQAAAESINPNGGGVQLIQPINGEYAWDWQPWAESTSGEVVKVNDPQQNQKPETAVIHAQNKNGSGFVMASIQITTDKVQVPPTEKLVLQGSHAVTVNLCENPWPSLEKPTRAPFRDIDPAADPDSTLNSGSKLFVNGPYFNFSTMYCRDAGDAKTAADDLPAMTINFVPATAVDTSEGILRQYLFTFGDDHPELKKDGIGIRIAANPMHYSIEDWYRSHGFAGSPSSVMVDGYRGVKDGATLYLSVANTHNPKEEIYSNVYIFSHNPDASKTTLGIFEQMVANLAFNINLTQGVGNVCEEGLDSAQEPSKIMLSSNGKPMACSDDFQCLNAFPAETNVHCGSYKLKLARDTVRLADFQIIQRALNAVGGDITNPAYPSLSAGTYLQSVSVSRWPSWMGQLSKDAAIKLPVDPVNKFISCGRCSVTANGNKTEGIGGICQTAKDCPKDETCSSIVNGQPTVDPETCWNELKHQYLCPSITGAGTSPSRVYQYRALNAGKRFELATDLEIPPPSSGFGKWWTPELVTEVSRCTGVTPDLIGLICEQDKDCRACANPKDDSTCKLPVVAGACQKSGGRFIYKDACSGKAFGDSGVCGDGVLGKACSNDNSPCAQDSDCKNGGVCTATEVCELGQTQAASCVTNDSKQGLKLQVCSECKAWVDDAKVSACVPTGVCGNGKIDKVCSTGARKDQGCYADNDCPSFDLKGTVACVNGPEVCDDGAENGTYGHCNKQCTGFGSFCGDGMLSPGETCDNGPSNNMSQGNGDYCDTKGNLNQSKPICDLSKSCSIDCKSTAPYCGDGVTTSPEKCDGQTETTLLAICTSGNIGAPCKVNADCGANGKCNGGVGSQATGICALTEKSCTQDSDCKDSFGGLNQNLGPCLPLATRSCENVTVNKCQTALKVCAKPDGVIDAVYTKFNPNNEMVCKTDDQCANQPGGKTSCRSLQELIVNCDPKGNDNPSVSQCGIQGVPGTCVAYPTAHIRSCNEQGAANQCSFPDWSSCQVLSKCGDGVLDAPSEECDDGKNNGDTKACTSQCKKNVCGDGKPFINVEECDNGDQNGKITCSADYNSTCQSCSKMCKFLSISGGYCGDGVKNGPEQCDGNKTYVTPSAQYSTGKLLSDLKANNVTNAADQLISALSPLLNADCLQSPCKQTQEGGVSCKALGYDFATNGTNPRIVSDVPDLASKTYADWNGSLEVLKSGSPFDGILTNAEVVMLQQCAGLTWTASPKMNVPDQDIIKVDNGGGGGKLFGGLNVTPDQLGQLLNIDPVQPKQAGVDYTYAVSFAPTTPAAFWQCVKEKGPALGISIAYGDGAMMCGNSCTFTGCGRCSDDVGGGSVSGQLVDAVYNQPIPGAKISLMYKGTLVKQIASDEDGKFILTGLNDRPECSQYKVVIDKYDDNPCTQPAPPDEDLNNPTRPKCGAPNFPKWTLPDINEAQRGGYWTLNVDSFQGTQKSFDAHAQTDASGHILMYPRPAYGEAYFSVLWTKPWYNRTSTTEVKGVKQTNPAIVGAINTHVILPEADAYGAPTQSEIDYIDNDGNPFPAKWVPSLCPYNTRIVNDGQNSRFCVRDVTYSSTLKGNTDLTKAPHAMLTCMHSAGEYVAGYGSGSDQLNGCPVEGFSACVERLGLTKSSWDVQAKACNAGQLNESDHKNPKNCSKAFWDTCDFYANGPLTTYFRYASYEGTEPIQLLWNNWGALSYPELYSNSPLVLSEWLKQKGFKAIISTRDTFQVIDAATIADTKGCKDMSGKQNSGYCKYWKVGELNPLTGDITLANKLSGPTRPQGVAVYDYFFQGHGMPTGADAGPNYCIDTSKGNSSQWRYLYSSEVPQTCSQKINNVDSQCGNFVANNSCAKIDAKTWAELNF